MCGSVSNDAGGTDVDAVVVGAGFSGLYMSHRLRELGLSVRVYEKAPDVGGTWYWNRYPGARCDSESHIYCYSFSEEIRREWQWTERYPEQPEILDYLRFVADRLDLRRLIEFETEVESAEFDDGNWTVTTDDGETVDSQFFISAVGCLSEPYVPEFENRDAFDGEWYHTARWPREGVDLDGKRVGVIGTGSTGIQLVPEVAERAAHLTVFQRTPNYAVPARNRPLSDDEWAEITDNYDEIWEDARFSWLGMPFEMKHATTAGLSDEEIEAALEERWQEGGFRFLHTFEDTLFNPETNEIVSEFLREKIRERVEDPETAEKLVPTDHPYGSKRPPMDYNGYYETFNREDVTLADVDENPITEFAPEGIRTTASLYELDTVIFATGFDAMTGALMAMDIRGRDGSVLSEEWADGPRTYLGLGVDGFPNLFTITGPQSPAVLSNMPVSIEQHVDWIADCIEYMRAEGYEYIEPRPEAAERWVSQTNALADQMLFSEAESWYRGANVPGKPRVFTPFPGGVETYRRECERVVENGYEGFELSESLDPPAQSAD
ncbi:NAD(P)-binding domain-containing protein [Halovenus sp. WSH3]|uniref:NAD(P)-binding domain-containing protein n=1 Tax=Halovenus carboxidivorans TaxID=2692199 RepID=A0A6B0T3K7_9EURY|nr:NAD(P)/FAD-dependent oxidoreductase [Halovenus carboxidivorans]MXR52858.1 NAD(P)-binding domain-containing protein [Halovenus carboxidivorans]